MTTDPPRLSIHVLGAAKGESIIVQLPDGRWGVVDSYAGSPDDPSTNPTVTFLRDKGVRELRIPLSDAPSRRPFSGMVQLLDEFPVRYFWHFGGQACAHFKQLVNYVQIEAGLEATEEAGKWGQAFPAIWERVERHRKARRTRLKHCGPWTSLYPYRPMTRLTFGSGTGAVG